MEKQLSVPQSIEWPKKVQIPDYKKPPDLTTMATREEIKNILIKNFPTIKTTN